jgi:hypothetical protein
MAIHVVRDKLSGDGPEGLAIRCYSHKMFEALTHLLVVVLRPTDLEFFTMEIRNQIRDFRLTGNLVTVVREELHHIVERDPRSTDSFGAIDQLSCPFPQFVNGEWFQAIGMNMTFRFPMVLEEPTDSLPMFVLNHTRRIAMNHSVTMND